MKGKGKNVKRMGARVMLRKHKAEGNNKEVQDGKMELSKDAER